MKNLINFFLGMVAGGVLALSGTLFLEGIFEIDAFSKMLAGIGLMVFIVAVAIVILWIKKTQESRVIIVVSMVSGGFLSLIAAFVAVIGGCCG